MATLKDGFYKIRFVPAGSQPTAVGGMYATGTNMGDDVKVDPSPDPQTVFGKSPGEITATISSPRKNDVAWSLANPISPKSSASAAGTIVLGNLCEEFALEPENGEDNAVYSIRVPSDSPGFGDFFVTVTDQTVNVQDFSTQSPPFIWQFVVPVASTKKRCAKAEKVCVHES